MFVQLQFSSYNASQKIYDSVEGKYIEYHDMYWYRKVYYFMTSLEK